MQEHFVEETVILGLSYETISAKVGSNSYSRPNSQKLIPLTPHDRRH